MTATPAPPPPARATAATTRLLTGIVSAALVRTRKATATEIVVGRIVVRLLDAELSLRAVEEATGLNHPQRKFDGQRALLVEDLDAFASALGIPVAELLEPSLTEDDQQLLGRIEAGTTYDADGEVLRGAEVGVGHELADRLARLAAQGLIEYCHRGGHILTACGSAWSHPDPTHP